MIDLKMFKSGIVFYIYNYNNLNDLFFELDKKMNKIKDFFDGSEKVMLKVENLKKKFDDIPKIIEKLETYNIKVKSILTEYFEETEKPIKKEKEEENMLIITKNIRSGQKISHKGHLLIIGNVHSGSEIIADGSVIIFGHCGGIVKAGLNIKPSYILTLSLNAPLIQIREVKHQLSKPYNSPVFVYEKGGKLFFEELNREEKI